jgi:DNA primase
VLSQNDIFHYLSMLGIQTSTKIKTNGKWINFSCPLAPWTHEKGADKSPSFGISLTEISAFSCYACHHHGTLSDFARLYCDLAGGDPRAAIDYSREQELPAMRDRAERAQQMRGNDPMARMWAASSVRAAHVKDWTIDFERPRLSPRMISRYDVDVEHPYIVKRGITPTTAQAWGLRIQPDYNRRGYDRLVFPVYDIQGHLLAYSSRMTWDKPTCTACDHTGEDVSWGMWPNDDGTGGCPKCHAFVPPKYMHSKGFTRNLYLYGEHLIDPAKRVGVLVEGNMSPLRLWQLGVKNVVATLGSKVGTELPNVRDETPGQQLYQAGKHFDELVLIADVDQAGASWCRTIQSFYDQASLGRKRVHVVELPEAGTDPADMRVTDEMLLKLLQPFNVW